MNDKRCASCGQIVRPKVERGAFLAYLDAPEVFYRGKLVPLPPVQCRLMRPLIADGKASREMLEMLLPYGVSLKAVDVHLCQMRKRLPNGVTIRSLGWNAGWELIDNALPNLMEKPRA